MKRVVDSDFKLLQSIVFHDPENARGREKLYYHGKRISISGGKILFGKQGELDLFAYFNVFNFGKWGRYAGINSFFLRLNLAGRFRVRVYRHLGARCSKNPWHDEIVRAEGWVTFPVPPTHGGGIYSVRIDAIENGVLHGGGWFEKRSPAPPFDCRIALIICTYRREDQVRLNLRLLSERLPAGWNVFVVDNGRTIPAGLAGEFDGRFHFFENPNTGGTGGFTRGLIEVINHEHRWTHALLMDDDVSIDPAALERTDALLRRLKPEYRRHFISGAMLRMDAPCVQHESSAHWNGVRVKHLRHNFDLSQPRRVLANARLISKKSQYAAWWYCVIPLTENTIDDLPVPLFVNGDDIEYSLRRAHGIILLNGIAVWHQPLQAKYHPVKRHYLAVRNGLIINARHGYPLLSSLALVGLRLLFQLSKGHWNEARMVLRGLSDFMKGPGPLKEADTEKLFDPVLLDRVARETRLTPAHVVRLVLPLIWKHQALRRAYRAMPLHSDVWREINRHRKKTEKTDNPRTMYGRRKSKSKETVRFS